MSIFTEVQMAAVPSNSFDLSHDVKLSMNMGDLVPVGVLECIPGDVVQMSSTVMARMAPMVAPVMHKVDIDVQHFFVPNRLLWSNWEKFITTGTPDVTTPAAPYLSGVTFTNGSLGDYLGLPTDKGLSPISALPFAAYQKIYNDYYRDQNLVTEVTAELIDGDNTAITDLVAIRKRAWQHDYFTSALPFAQKGDEVTLSLGGTANIQLDPTPPLGAIGVWKSADGSNFAATATANVTGDTVTGNPYANSKISGKQVQWDPNGSLEADLSTATAITVNELRWAIRLQEYLERNARGGTRYIEHILAHFGVHSSDKRLQRAEFLGGSRQHMVISEVLQNSEGVETPQGNMAGHGISVGQGKGFKYFVEEHGFVISICSIRPKTAYQQGLHRLWSRFDPLKYAWPTFANLGEQEILNQEIYYDVVDGKNEDTFGYTPRYSEYKYLDSRVAGDFRTSLNFWHMGRIFNSRPVLNSSFITCDPTTRIFAVEDATVDKIYMQCLNTVFVRRRLPKFGIPTI